MATIWSRFMKALAAFREEFITSSKETLYNDDFNSWDARRVRYAINWAMYESTVYRNILDFARTYKTKYGLYQYVRSIYNPSYRLGEFYKSHLWGGSLDMVNAKTGILPVVTKFDNLRPFIIKIWQWSNLPVEKDVFSLKGAVLGDVIIRVVDDAAASKVYLEYTNPATVTDLIKDRVGNIKGYTIEYDRVSPNNNQMVTYKEVVSRDGQNVKYQTFMNNALYAWNGIASEWVMPYGFVPMVHIKHNNTGDAWGWSEFQASRSKIHEVDDLASILTDQVRKQLDAKWFIIGASRGRDNAKTITNTASSESTGRPEPGREEVNLIYVPGENASVQAQVVDMNIEGVCLHITNILQEIERDYPELRFDNLRSSGTVSGEALKVARQPAETKMVQRRANYDNALIRAQQMALSIGGMQGYFTGISPDSFERGLLDHSFADRPVFTPNHAEKLNDEILFWQAASQATAAGMPLDLYLERAGWPQEDIARVMAERTGQDAGQ